MILMPNRDTFYLFSCRRRSVCCVGTHPLLYHETVPLSQWLAISSLLLLVNYVAMVTDGLQDDVMGELTSRVEHQHTCRLMDSLFMALRKSVSDFDLYLHC